MSTSQNPGTSSQNTDTVSKIWKTVISLPSELARRFNSKYNKDVEEKHQRYMKAYDSLEYSLGKKTIDSLRPVVEKHQLSLVRMSISELYFYISVVVVIMIAFLIVGVRSSTTFVMTIFNLQTSPQIGLSDTIIAFISFVFALALGLSLFSFDVHKWPNWASALFGLLLPFSAALPIAFLGYIVTRFGIGLDNARLFSIITGFSGAFITLMCFPAILLFAWTLNSGLKLYRRNQDPLAVLVDSLINILLRLSRTPLNQLDVKDKLFVIGEIEEAAECVVTYLSKNLRMRDLANDVAMRKMATEIASALREKKVLIAVSGPNSTKEALSFFGRVFVRVIMNYWSLLERQSVPEVSQRGFLRSFLERVVRPVLIGLLPLAGLVIIQQSPIKLTGDLANYATIGFVLWAILTLIAAIDPQFNNKITGLKDFTDVITGKK